MELIDTQWNVNFTSEELSQLANIRINRYIVECKYGWTMIDQYIPLELIDTQWNVNVLLLISSRAKNLELIDTQWNVNLDVIFSLKLCECELIDTQWNVN